VTVYADLYFLLNLVVDWVLLYAAGRAAREVVRPRRLGAAALLGAVYATAELWFPGTMLFGLAAKLAASVAMVATAYGVRPLARCLRLCAYLYAASLLLAGAALAFTLLGSRSPRPGWGGVPWWALAAALAGVGWLAAAAWARRRLAVRDGWLLPLSVWVGEGCARCTALVDTGNLLRDPLGDGPVLVADPAALAPAVPPGLASVLGSGDAARAAEAVAGTPWSSRLRVVPFQGIGVEGGVLLGLRADRVRVGGVETRGITVAVAGRRLDPGGRYQALVPAALVAGAGDAAARAS
jgi:stage II sporulation protein GA (sporulation sigma-E factor processing peptidase)